MTTRAETQAELEAQRVQGQRSLALLQHKHGHLRTTVAPVDEDIPDGYAAVKQQGQMAQAENAIPDPYAVVLEQGRQANRVKQFRSISQ